MLRFLFKKSDCREICVSIQQACPCYQEWQGLLVERQKPFSPHLSPYKLDNRYVPGIPSDSSTLPTRTDTLGSNNARAPSGSPIHSRAGGLGRSAGRLHARSSARSCCCARILASDHPSPSLPPARTDPLRGNARPGRTNTPALHLIHWQPRARRSRLPSGPSRQVPHPPPPTPGQPRRRTHRRSLWETS